MELLQHWLSHTCRTCLQPRQQAQVLGAIIVNTGLRFPFLMHSTLAFAALHLSYTLISRRDYYLSQAKELQDNAVAAFNHLGPNIDESIAMAAFLFSFVTGVHRMCYVLAFCRREPGLFLTSIRECIDILRGVTITLGGHMAMLRTTELGPLLFKEMRLNDPAAVSLSQDAIGRLHAMINAMDIAATTVAVLRAAVNNLHEAYAETQEADDESVGLAVVWMMKCPEGYTQLLAEDHPAALVVLAHVTPLLHHNRKCWAIGDSATFMLSSVYEKLPADWRPWLEWPRQVIDQ